MDSGADIYLRYLDGDNDALSELIREYRDGLILFLLSVTNDACLAEDAAEDTFVKLIVKRPRFDKTASFKTWLYTIGRNVAIDSIRKEKRRRTVNYDETKEIEDEVLTLELSYVKTEQIKQLNEALRQIKPEHRQIIWLVFFEELSLKEAAAVMHKTTHAAEVLFSRAKQSLKNTLTKEGFVYESL